MKTVSVTGVLTVNGAHGVPVIADMVFEEVKEADTEMIVLPGGLPGATNLDGHKGLSDLIMAFAEAGKPLSAICAAPLVYGKRGLLKGRRQLVIQALINIWMVLTIQPLWYRMTAILLQERGPVLQWTFHLQSQKNMSVQIR